MSQSAPWFIISLFAKHIESLTKYQMWQGTKIVFLFCKSPAVLLSEKFFYRHLQDFDDVLFQIEQLILKEVLMLGTLSPSAVLAAHVVGLLQGAAAMFDAEAQTNLLLEHVIIVSL